MSYSLMPVSRRRFLLSTLGAGAALLVSDRLAWGQSPATEDHLALLSDIHINALAEKVERGVNMTDHLRHALADVLSLPQRPQVAVFTGDLAHRRGDVKDYVHLMELLDPLTAASMPVHLAMGNHDHRQHFADAFKAAERDPGVELVEGRYVHVLSMPRADWVILDSLDVVSATPGVVGEGQLKWLKATLDAGQAGGKPVIVVVHHGPEMKKGRLRPPATQPEKVFGLVDTHALMDVLLPARRVKALVYGHSHVWSTQQLGGLHLVNLPAVGYLLRKGTFSAWASARVRKDGMDLELRCIDPTHASHGQVTKLHWRA